MDLSKVFDTLNHEAHCKASAYGFTNESLWLIESYFTNGWQRAKINESFSKWVELLQRVPQGSVFCPLLFNIYLNAYFSYLILQKYVILNMISGFLPVTEV